MKKQIKFKDLVGKTIEAVDQSYDLDQVVFTTTDDCFAIIEAVKGWGEDDCPEIVDDDVRKTIHYANSWYGEVIFTEHEIERIRSEHEKLIKKQNEIAEKKKQEQKKLKEQKERELYEQLKAKYEGEK